MSSLELGFLNKLGDQWQEATPGFCLQAFHKGKKVADIEVGETYALYDWASLTKIVFTITALMAQHDEKRFSVNDRVSKWVEWFPKDYPARIRDLMTHSAGMTWWYPFYKDVVKKTNAKTTPEQAWLIFQGILKKRILKDLEKAKFNSKIKSVYSDLDFFLLGLSLEAISEQGLYENWLNLRDRMGLTETDFERDNKPTKLKSLYAPTENDKVWRKKTLQGEVHDQNTWSFKGVAPHAGLFGPIEDLSRWGLLLRGAMMGKKSRAFPSPETVQKFTKRSIPRSRGDWGLGFSMPTKGAASCGPLFSLDSVGHLGFTGTSLWFDPKKDLLVTILSNRIHPTVENKKFAQMRPLIHTWIYEGLGK